MAVIYCFTSTGNSLYAARKIADFIGAETLPVTCESATTDEDVIGFVCPVFFWGAPKIVLHFVRNLKISNPDAYVFAVATCGDAAHGAADEIRKCLHGHELSYTASIKSVENYVPFYKVNNTDEIHAAAEQSIQSIAKDIAERKKKRDGCFWFANRLVKSIFPGNRADCDRKFNVSGSCTGCGICVKVCPVNNISVTNGQPVFGHRCEHCISCVHCCPAKAINYGKSQDRTRYVHPEIGVNGLIEFNSRREYDQL